MHPSPLVFYARTPDQEPERPVRERVRAQSLGARQALEQARSQSPAPGPEEWTFHKTPAGAPAPQGIWRWSISHDAWLVAAAVYPGPIGVDLERIALRRQALVERVLNPAERGLFQGQDEALTFTRAWTAKEAVLKSAGVGLAELSQCRIERVLDSSALLLRHRGLTARVEQFQSGEHLLAVHVPGPEWTATWRSCAVTGLQDEGTSGGGPAALKSGPHLDA